MSLLPDVTGRHVLDAGCGAGWYSEQLAGRGARVIAIDRSARMVAITKKRLAGAFLFVRARKMGGACYVIPQGLP
jgi:2-polyprenyl-3-methyl-5-hydroxy-6-metoxy-1,4-benzoquinol methylase